MTRAFGMTVLAVVIASRTPATGSLQGRSGYSICTIFAIDGTPFAVRMNSM